MKLTVEVPYGDIDAMGHLNNVAYLRYLETARQKYWLAMRGSTDFWDVDFVIARCEIDYRSSVSMGEVLEIEIHVARMGASSFDFAYGSAGRTEAGSWSPRRRRRRSVLTGSHAPRSRSPRSGGSRSRRSSGATSRSRLSRR